MLRQPSDDRFLQRRTSVASHRASVTPPQNRLAAAAAPVNGT